MAKPRLTEHQQRVLAIIEAGGVHGVMADSIVREESAQHLGRLRSEILRTAWSLQRRGLVTSEEVIVAEGINPWGHPYATRATRYTVADTSLNNR